VLDHSEESSLSSVLKVYLRQQCCSQFWDGQPCLHQSRTIRRLETKVIQWAMSEIMLYGADVSVLCKYIALTSLPYMAFTILKNPCTYGLTLDRSLPHEFWVLVFYIFPELKFPELEFRKNRPIFPELEFRVFEFWEFRSVFKYQ
jgi:hypothetical protein